MDILNSWWSPVIIVTRCWAACGIFYILHGYSSLTLYKGEERLLIRDDSGVRTRDIIHIRHMGIGSYTKYITWQSQLYRVTKPLIVTKMTDHRHVCDVTCHIRWQRHASNRAADTYVSRNSGEFVPVPVIGYRRYTDRFNTGISRDKRNNNRKWEIPLYHQEGRIGWSWVCRP